MTHNSNAAIYAGTLPDIAVAFSATEGTMAPPNGTVTAGTAASVFMSTSAFPGTGCADVDNQHTCASINVDGVCTGDGHQQRPDRPDIQHIGDVYL